MAGHWRRLAALLLAAACSSDATAPDPSPADPEPEPSGLSGRAGVAGASNRAPEAVGGGIPAQHLPGPGAAVVVDVSAYFADPDGDTLAFAASSSDTAVVSAVVDGDTLRMTGGGTGGAGAVAVAATDPSGLSAVAAVAVTVNRAPEAVGGGIPAQRLPGPGAAAAVDVSAYFADPDGDALAFAASSADTAVVSAAVDGDTLRLTGGSAGGAGAVVVTASDPDGLSARAVFAVEVADIDERAALAALYEATDGQNWRNNGNWLTDAPLGEWHGVTVDADGRVESLDLRDNGLGGPIPPELGNLTSLETLHLGISLEVCLTWPSCPDMDWGSRGELNYLTGPIPPELGGLASLRTLDLSGNVLRGSIPPELGGLASLETLILRGNISGKGLTGPIPPELGDLASLKTLDLSWNGLDGPIPPELGNLASLETLHLGRNVSITPYRSELGGLTGSIPPELGNLARLRSLDLENNNLTGPIPPELGGLASLERLDLGANGLTGPIPPELGDLASLKWLDLGRNELTGPIPLELGNLASLETLDLDRNEGLTGPLPNSFSQLRLRWLSARGTLLCVPWDDEALQSWLSDLGGPGIESGPRGTGVAPTCDVVALAALYHATDGPNWTNPNWHRPGNRNWLTDAPLWEWHGVIATRPVPGRGLRVTGLNLVSRDLTGPIPPELGDLARLQTLNLSGNDSLTGPIPPELGNFTSLVRLDLRSTGLTGPIPPELGNLASLETLDLRRNRELTGPLPSSLTQLRRLRVLRAEGTGLCAPTDEAFQSWLRTVPRREVANCAAAAMAGERFREAVEVRIMPVPVPEPRR